MWWGKANSPDVKAGPYYADHIRDWPVDLKRRWAVIDPKLKRRTFVVVNEHFNSMPLSMRSMPDDVRYAMTVLLMEEIKLIEKGTV